jgi:hypothetical protein
MVIGGIAVFNWFLAYFCIWLVLVLLLLSVLVFVVLFVCFLFSEKYQGLSSQETAAHKTLT